MTGTDVITSRARPLLNDAGTVRWTDAQLLAWLNDGVADIVRRRTDAGIDAYLGVITVTELTTVGGTISIADKWRGALTDYICWRAFSQNGGNRQNTDPSRGHREAYELALRTL